MPPDHTIFLSQRTYHSAERSVKLEDKLPFFSGYGPKIWAWLSGMIFITLRVINPLFQLSKQQNVQGSGTDMNSGETGNPHRGGG